MTGTERTASTEELDAALTAVIDSSAELEDGSPEAALVRIAGHVGNLAVAFAELLEHLKPAIGEPELRIVGHVHADLERILSTIRDQRHDA